MADDDVLMDQEEGDEIDERQEALNEQLAIPESSYSQVQAAAVKHALLNRGAALPTDRPWTCFGPRNVGGRIISLAQDPSNPLTIYAGSAHGGLWRTINGGDTWRHLDAAPPAAGADPIHADFPVGAMVVHPTRPNTIYIGTGSVLNTYVSGQGVFRVSTAGPLATSATYERLAPAPDSAVSPFNAANGAALRYSRIELDPDDPDRFWIASQTGLWRCHITNPGNPPVFNWRRDFPLDPALNPPAFTPVLQGTPPIPAFLSPGEDWLPYATDLRVARDPRHTEEIDRPAGGKVPRFLVIYVAVHAHGVYRGVYDRNKGDAADAVTWEKRLDVPNTNLNAAGPPNNNFGRVVIAICRNQPQHVFAVFQNSGNAAVAVGEQGHATWVYRSSDNGETWQQGQRIPNAGQYAAKKGIAYYALVLEAHPDNPDILACGEVDLCLSRDRGRTWQTIMNWLRYTMGDKAQHADQHALFFDVGNRTRLWSGNDGGLSVARDLRRTPDTRGYWRKRSNGILAAQFQDVTTHPLPRFHFLSGGALQDNGNWVSYGGQTWYRIGTGDGARTAIHRSDARRYLLTSQSQVSLGFVAAPPRLINNVGVRDVPAVNDTMTVGGTLTVLANGPFVPPLEQSPTTPGQTLVGWRQSAATAIAQWIAAPAGNAAGAAAAIALPVPAITNGEDAPALAFGPVVAGAASAWIGTTDGRLFSTPNGSPAGAWTESVAYPRTNGVLRSVSGIAVHPTDARVVAVTSISSPRKILIQISTMGAPGVAQFTVQFFRNAAMSTPTPAQNTIAGRSVPVPGASLMVAFIAANYVAADQWTVDPDGQFNSATPAAQQAKLTLTPTGGRTIIITIATAGAVGPAGPATFNYRVGANPPSADLPTGPVVELPGTPLVLSFSGGPFVAGHRWTIPADGPAAPFAGAVGNVQVLARLHGRVHLTLDGGAHWQDISYPTAPPAPPLAPDAASLPPCPISSARFAQDSANAMCLFIGTLAGVYVFRNVPVPPAALPVNPTWRPFNGTAGRELPLSLVNDIELVNVPASGADPVRRILRVATFGRGIWDCDLTSAVQRRRIFIRQNLYENGLSYPRTIPPTTAAAGGFANADSDYRLPVPTVAPPAVPEGSAPGYDFTHAYDIRIDSAPLNFFDDTVDPVEFDEELGADTLTPAATNAIYVQVNNAGTQPVARPRVHLYFMRSPAAAPLVQAAGGRAPAGLQNPAAFLSRPNFDPVPPATPLPPPAARHNTWQRVGPPVRLDSVDPYEPVVVRFDWTPPDSLASSNVALLAICDGGAGDPIAVPAAGTSVANFIDASRHAALRIVPVGALAGRHVFIRDGIDDSGKFGEVAFAGRSPDIIVVPAGGAAPADVAAARTAFKDLLDLHPQDRVHGSVQNEVFVRVWNVGPVAVPVEVNVWAVKLDATNAPALPAAWTRLTPDPATAANTVTVDPNDVGYVHVAWPAPIDDPNPGDAYKAYALVALIRSVDAAAPALSDPLPDVARVTDPASFWDLFRTFFDADNAAVRVLRYES